MNLKNLQAVMTIEMLARMIRERYDDAIRSDSEASRLIECFDQIERLVPPLKEAAQQDIETDKFFRDSRRPSPSELRKIREAINGASRNSGNSHV